MSGIYIPEIPSVYDFNKTFFDCCRTLKKRVRADYDAVVAITGDEGSSKSTLANHIGFYTDKEYTLEKNCLFSPNPKLLVRCIRELPRFSTINADEAVKILYKQEWWLQTFINKFYRLCRQDNKISIMPMPRFNEFNEGFRNHRILFWIHLLDRGIGIVYEKDWSPFVKDPWHFDENQKMIQKIIMRRRYHEQNIDNRLKILEKVQNYLGTITFPDLAPELRQKYKELAAVQKYEGLEEEFDRGKFYTKMKKVYSDRLEKILDVVQKENGLSRKQIGKRIGISPQLLSRIDDDE